MSEILSIDQLKKMATTVIEIPDFNNEGVIKIRVQKPRMLAMAAQGKIPNHLLGTVQDLLFPGRKKGEPKPEDVGKTYELYCRVCMVEPTYEEMKDIITDEQMKAIFDWATDDVFKLSKFRADRMDGSNNNASK